MIKEFFKWMGVKKEIHAANHTPPFISEGDLWWCSIGENVGVEIDGKGTRFTRPVIVLKKFGRLGFFGIPVTTKLRVGSWYYGFEFKDIKQIAILSQARFVSYKRLDRRMGSLPEQDTKKIKEAFLSLF